MKLLKIRDRFINIDLLQTAIIGEDSITITISGESFDFSGSDAKMITQWLNRYARDIGNRNHNRRVQSDIENSPIEEWTRSSSVGGLFRKPFAS